MKVKRSSVKRYGVIFTCLSMRAIHLEIVVDLSAEAIVNALRRFLARRGPIYRILSNNGTNFNGARRQILRALAQREVCSEVEGREIVWDFQSTKSIAFRRCLGEPDRCSA